jgi:NADH-ubiquinone oxidoreductase chain 5
LEASACYIKMVPWIFLEMFDASWGFFGEFCAFWNLALQIF